MNLELRRITYNARLSEETSAYAADLYVDGVLFAHVSNDGHGGCDRQHPARGKTMSDIVALNAQIRSTYPKQSYDFGEGKKGEYETDLEALCHNMLTDHLVARDLQRLLKRTVAYVDPRSGKILSFKGKHEGVARAHLITDTLRKVPGAVILNNLPFDQALARYKETA